MEIRAFLDDNGTAVVSFGEPSNMAGFEVEWHEAVLTLKGADGSLERSVTFAPGVAPVTAGPDAAPVAEHAGEPTEEGVKLWAFILNPERR